MMDFLNRKSYWRPERFLIDEDAERVSSQSSSEATGVKSEVRAMEDRLERLTLVCNALWELLKDRTQLTEEDLLSKVQEIDLRDGVADGKITKSVQKCPKCNRSMSPKHKRCLYCGYEKLNKEAFDSAL